MSSPERSQAREFMPCEASSERDSAKEREREAEKETVEIAIAPTDATAWKHTSTSTSTVRPSPRAEVAFAALEAAECARALWRSAVRSVLARCIDCRVNSVPRSAVPETSRDKIMTKLLASSVQSIPTEGANQSQGTIKRQQRLFGS